MNSADEGVETVSNGMRESDQEGRNSSLLGVFSSPGGNFEGNWNEWEAVSLLCRACWLIYLLGLQLFHFRPND
jgi:hypothetical protein